MLMTLRATVLQIIQQEDLNFLLTNTAEQINLEARRISRQWKLVDFRGETVDCAKVVCEFGWVVGRPESTVTASYFHAKYVPEGRGKGSGAGENLGQNIFHRPASSGQYAVVLNVDLYKIGRNDISLEYAKYGLIQALDDFGQPLCLAN